MIGSTGSSCLSSANPRQNQWVEWTLTVRTLAIADPGRADFGRNRRGGVQFESENGPPQASTGCKLGEGSSLVWMMMHKFLLQFLVVFLVCGACGGQQAGSKGAESPPPGMESPVEPEMPADGSAVPQAASAAAEMSVADAQPVAQAQAAAPSARGGATAAKPTSAAQRGGAPLQGRSMLDIQGTLVVEVADVEEAVAEMRKLARKYSAQVTHDQTQRGGGRVTARLTLRVPSAKIEELLPEIEAVGQILSRQITASDVTKQYLDTSLRLRNLEVTLARYEELLRRANTVQEMLTIEQHITRVRGEIEQLKGQMRYMQDRVARATLDIALQQPEDEEPELIVRPEAKFFPGVRLGYANDFWRKAAPNDERLTSTSMWNFGLSLSFAPEASIDLDVLRATDRDSGGIDGAVLTLGGKIYSEFLGAGRRKFVEPYLNWRLGYARLRGFHEAAVGAGLGLDVFKNEFVTLSADARCLVLFASDIGAHALVQPVLGFNAGF